MVDAARLMDAARAQRAAKAAPALRSGRPEGQRLPERCPRAPVEVPRFAVGVGYRPAGGRGALGIRLVRSRLGSPQDNGGHERMHRDLSELQMMPARSRRAQQRQCDRWVIDFDHVCPHDALGGKTPAEMYRGSPRRSLPPKVPSYPPD